MRVPFEPDLGNASVGKWEDKAVLPREVRLFLSMNIHVTINGKARSVSAGMSLLSFLKLLEIDPSRVAVEYNREIIDRSQFGSIGLKESDCLEIITFVGGGNGEYPEDCRV